MAVKRAPAPSENTTLITEIELAVTPERMSHPENATAQKEARDFSGRLEPGFVSDSTRRSFNDFSPRCQSWNRTI